MTTDYTYNPARGLLESVSVTGPSGALFSTAYTHQPSGRIATADSTDDAGDFTYAYDYAGRLLSADNTSNDTFDRSFTYDRGGNMMSKSDLGTYLYPLPTDPRPHTPTAVGAESFAYDANGNMLAGLAGKTMTYDGENRPLSVTYGGAETLYHYGPDGTRVLKETAYDLTAYAGPLEIRNFGTPGEQIIWHLSDDVRLADGEVSYLHRDHLASVRAISHATGSLGRLTSYTPFGVPTDTDYQPAVADESKAFIGERYDDETGLSYLNARYYDPLLGRFIQPDWFEVTEPGVGTNRYAYSFNDPVNIVDISGNDAIAVAAYNQFKNEKGTFEGRAQRLGFDQSFSAHTGQGLLDGLAARSSVDNPITELAIGSHGSGSALYMNPDAGLYTDTQDTLINTWIMGDGKQPGAATVTGDLAQRLQNGDIVFDKGAIISLLGCSTSNYPVLPDWIAETISETVPDAYVVGATTQSNPNHMTLPNGRVTDSNTYVARGGGIWEIWQNGKVVGEMGSEYDPTDTDIEDHLYE